MNPTETLMKPRNRSAILLLAFVVFPFLPPGCRKQETAGSRSGMANPASVNCLKQGGRLDIRRDPGGGQVGVCVFEDGSECGEWALFRGECRRGERRGPAPAP